MVYVCGNSDYCEFIAATLKRSRIMIGNPQRCLVSARQLDNRHATAGCLLALLLLLPCAAQSSSVVTLTVFAVLYVTVAVPLAAGYYTLKALVSKLRTLAEPETSRYWLRQVKIVLQWCHNSYYQIESIHTTTNQILFFMACEKVMCPEQKHSCLYVLLFYTVIAYLHRSLQTRKWTQLLHETTTADFLRLTTAFIVVRLGKSVAMSLVLLSFTIQFNNLEPTFNFVGITAIYFMMTQFKVKSGEETELVAYVRHLELQILEGFEAYWVPFLVRSWAVVISACMCVVAGISGHPLLFFALGYANVFVSWMKTSDKFWKPLQFQRSIVSQFPRATPQQMAATNDYTCAVCLEEMRPLICRVTKCGHIFHTQCLHKCFMQFGQCPLCKRHFYERSS